MDGLFPLFALLCGGACAWGFYRQGRAEDPLAAPSKRAQQTALLEPFTLPACIVIWFAVALLFWRTRQGSMFLVVQLVLCFLYISVYYALLLCTLPLLRRLFSARACATLWLLPNFLYLLANFRLLNDLPPLVALTLPRRWLGAIALVWGVGFVLVLLGQVLSHLRYRRFLLGAAKPVRDGELAFQWENEQRRRSAKKLIPMVVSERARTPLTIGCFPGTMRLVLPHLNYTPEEFQLIFRHEMRHIQRADNRTKASLGFYTALCWFNPLMWAARRKVSDDLELSCDELVLTGEDEFTRQRYARLLLDTAGSGKGYTTCLSAAASSLRYRLKHIVRPRKRLSGIFLVALTLCILVLGSNAVALTDSPDTVQAQVFDQSLARGAVASIYLRDWEELPENRCVYRWDEEALTEYLASLTGREVYTTDPYLQQSNGRRALILNYRLETPSPWTTSLLLCDGLLIVEFPYRSVDRKVFLLEDELDWTYLASLLDLHAAAPEG